MPEKTIDRRRAPRAAISFPVECDLLLKRAYFYTVSKDLSCSGAKILTEQFLPKGSVIKINVNMIDQMVELKARVAWCNKERAGERYLIGVEFIEVNRNKNVVLSRLLNTIQ